MTKALKTIHQHVKNLGWKPPDSNHLMSFDPRNIYLGFFICQMSNKHFYIYSFSNCFLEMLSERPVYQNLPNILCIYLWSAAHPAKQKFAYRNKGYFWKSSWGNQWKLDSVSEGSVTDGPCQRPEPILFSSPLIVIKVASHFPKPDGPTWRYRRSVTPHRAAMREGCERA